MKKLIKILLVVLLGGLSVYGFVQYKFISSENMVRDYLTAEEGVPENSIITEPFIANLEGEKNWMVSVKIEGHTSTYYYYVNKHKKIVLESYVESGVENVLNEVVN